MLKGFEEFARRGNVVIMAKRLPLLPDGNPEQSHAVPQLHLATEMLNRNQPLKKINLFRWFPNISVQAWSEI